MTTATITVLDDDAPVNASPVANDDVAATDEDIPAVIAALANDSDPDGDPLTITGFSQGTNGAVALNGDGTFTYMPQPDFNGTDSFSYMISDGRGGSDVARVDVVVAPVDDVPAPIVVVKQVAGTTTSIPLGIGTFTGFAGEPAACAFDVAFRGLGSGNQQGLYVRPFPGLLMRLVDGTTSIPGGSGSFTGFSDFSLHLQPGDPHRVAFVGEGPGGQRGIYSMTYSGPSSGGPPVLVADLSMVIPGGQGRFTTLTNPLFVAGQPTQSVSTAFLGSGDNGQQGVFLNPGTGGLPIALADTSSAIPGGSGTFNAFSRLATTAGQDASSLRPVGFIGHGATGQQGVYFVSGDGMAPAPPPVKVVDRDSDIPGGQGTFATFSSLSLRTTPGDPCHQAAFIASGAAGQLGVYTASFGSASCSTAAKIAHLSTPMPGGSGAFASFHALSASGAHVAFLASGGGGQKGSSSPAR